MMDFEELMEEAKWLEHERTKNAHMMEDPTAIAMYDAFANLVELVWQDGTITNHEFNLIILTAFYDYPDGLKPDPEFDI